MAKHSEENSKVVIARLRQGYRDMCEENEELYGILYEIRDNHPEIKFSLPRDKYVEFYEEGIKKLCLKNKEDFL